jgi:hypothetical protein
MHVVKLGTASSSAIVVALPYLRDNPFRSLKNFNGGNQTQTGNPSVERLEAEPGVEPGWTRTASPAADPSATPPLETNFMNRHQPIPSWFG